MNKTIQTKFGIILSILMVMMSNPLRSQNENENYYGVDDDELIAKKFAQTIIKLGLHTYYSSDRDNIIMLCENYAVVLHGGLLAIKNPTFENIKEVVVSNLLPDYSEQGTFLETVFDKELMRDVDQYVKYARTFLDYGLNMTQYDSEVRVYLSPEKGVLEEYVAMDGGIREGETYGGLTAAQYQENVMAIYSEINAYEPTGDPAVDDAAIMAIIESYFSESEDRDNVLDLMTSLNETQWTGDEEMDNPLLERIFEDYFEALENIEEEVEETEDEETVLPGNEGWNNGLNELMANIGAGDRNVYSRYGEYSEPYYSESRNRTGQGQTEAQEALTNVVKTWETLQNAKYIERAVELEQIGRELIENGVSYDTGQIEEFYGIMRQLWETIFNTN